MGTGGIHFDSRKMTDSIEPGMKYGLCRPDSKLRQQT